MPAAAEAAAVAETAEAAAAATTATEAAAAAVVVVCGGGGGGPRATAGGDAAAVAACWQAWFVRRPWHGRARCGGCAFPLQVLVRLHFGARFGGTREDSEQLHPRQP